VACHGAFVNVSPALGPHQRVHTVVGPDRRAVASRAGTMGSVEADVRRRVRMADARTALVRGIGDTFGFTRVHVHAGFPLRLESAVRPVPEVFSRVG
jgi:hypothetical protein